MNVTRKCNICHEIKIINEFNKSIHSPLGYQYKCRECHKKLSRVYYAKNRLKKINTVKKYLKTDKGKVTDSKKYIRHKVECLARVRTRYLVQKGIIKKANCEICDDQNSQIHHKNYENLTDIMWLCSKHHGLIHQVNN